ncbi:protocatechuate 3,4-dioxygenase [Novosphingobium umbonatum]|uniref:Protocatechuate 3,4-dioxygenase n=1 Tax=Novosphingobium umbonatum TaxID=1908524 RepID=A0A3S2UQS5_9SPHN|nr:class III extradiol dioxygenase family protein [Novosphingobium umbonatum]RVU02266.1 protocatechuate 3,4-dioxygenase [Novosphingobium umbonatum]
MAQVLAGLGTSHVPVIGRTLKAGTQAEVGFKPFYDRFEAVKAWAETQKPTVAVVIYNDHGLNFFLDHMPTFALGVATDYRPADEGFGEPVPRIFQGAPDLGWHMVNSLIADDFDISTCRKMELDHACTTALDLIWGADSVPPVAIIPVVINAVQPPFPKPSRCLAFGCALGKAIRSYTKDARVLMIGSGGLSHELGQFGKINQPFDLMCMDKIVGEPEALAAYDNDQIVDLAGAQGVELMTWLVMRGALASTRPDVLASIYHAPISHTGGAMMLMSDSQS